MKGHSTGGAALVLGLGESGLAAARLLLRQGYRVWMADERGDGEAALAQAGLDSRGVTLTRGLPASGEAPGFAVISPGFAVDHPWLAGLRARDIPLIPEFEYGVAALPGTQVIAVTGSNGKSSLVKWLADIVSAAGHRALPAGNYGLPPCAVALEKDPPAFLVLELSSFQLEQAAAFRPRIAVLLNLAPNHLDRHGSLEVYARAKARLFAHMTGEDLAVVHAPALESVRGEWSARVHPVCFADGRGHAYGAESGRLWRNGEMAVDLSGTWWGRPPLLTNAAAALAVLDRLNIAPGVMRAAADAFVPLPHRLEEFAVFRGVRFINDSKASTLTALAAAVSAGPEKKHLIAGGILKETDVNFVKEILAENCRFVYCIGSAAQKLVDSWRDAVPCANCGDLNTAVRRAMQEAKAGEVVMLSPGGSSFDQFTSYAQRGMCFKQRVLECIQEKKQCVEKTMQGVRS